MITTSRRGARSAREGIVLVWTLFAVFTLMGASFVTASLARTDAVLAETDRRRAEAEALGEAAVEAAVSEIQRTLRLNGTPLSHGQFTVDGQVAAFEIALDAPPAVIQSRAGLNELVSVYRISGTGTSEGVTREIRRMVKARVIPIFQFAIFFENDLEFYNPAPWEIRGRVHCNSDIYVRSWKPLTFDTNYLRSAGSFYGRPPFGDYDALRAIPPRIRRWTGDPFDALTAADFSTLPTQEEYALLGIDSTGGLDSDFAGTDSVLGFLGESLLRFGPILGSGTSTLQTSAHGVTRLEPPTIDDLSAFSPSAGGDWSYDPRSGTYTPAAPGEGTHERGYYLDNAGLVIEGFEDGSWKAFDASGSEVTDALRGAITAGSIFDRRQAGSSRDSLQQFELDVAALTASGYFPPNGLVYMHAHGSGSGTDVKAFTVSNASEIPSGLTLMSPDSIYLEGDFNTVQPKPAAAIADAINLLSNAWDGTKGPGELPTASETTYNVSIVAGDVASTSSVFSGGPHNLPRRHENWRGVPEHINGSIVSTFRSRHATGDFGLGGDYYLPPNRFWRYDDRLDDLSNMPPFTPVAVELGTAITWTSTP